MKITTLGIYGMEHVVKALCGKDSDSFATHIEDPVTMETAPHAFSIGENDTAMLKEACQKLPIRVMIRVWFQIDDEVLASWIAKNLQVARIGTTLMADYSDLRELKYMRINEATVGNIADIMKLNDWINTLPYQELLTA